jgi:heme-degrading monooxygenase HmoA
MEEFDQLLRDGARTSPAPRSKAACAQTAKALRAKKLMLHFKHTNSVPDFEWSNSDGSHTQTVKGMTDTERDLQAISGRVSVITKRWKTVEQQAALALTTLTSSSADDADADSKASSWFQSKLWDSSANTATTDGTAVEYLPDDDVFSAALHERQEVLAAAVSQYGTLKRQNDALLEDVRCWFDAFTGTSTDSLDDPVLSLAGGEEQAALASEVRSLMSDCAETSQQLGACADTHGHKLQTLFSKLTAAYSSRLQGARSETAAAAAAGTAALERAHTSAAQISAALATTLGERDVLRLRSERAEAKATSYERRFAKERSELATELEERGFKIVQLQKLLAAHEERGRILEQLSRSDPAIKAWLDMANSATAARKRASNGVVPNSEGEAALRRRVKVLMERNHALAGRLHFTLLCCHHECDASNTDLYT